MKTIKELKYQIFPEKYGNIAWIIASGASLDHVRTEFFQGLFTIGCNLAGIHFPCKLNITHHQKAVDILHRHNIQPIIYSEFEKCDFEEAKIIDIADNYMYCHEQQGYLENNYAPFLNHREDTIFSGETIVLDAIGLTYYFGFKKIILCGTDCCTFLGYDSNFAGYYDNQEEINLQSQGHALRSFDLIRQTRDFLYKHNRTLIYSLSPFIGAWNEGLKIDKFPDET